MGSDKYVDMLPERNYVGRKKYRELKYGKVLRKIFGGKIQGGRWERRTNREIYDIFKEPNIIGIVRAQRMRWIGHVVRMKDHRIQKMVLIHEVGGGKRRGRPRQRWKKAVEDDIRKLNIGNWKEKS
ncbi:hypothetical protein NQ318_004397 [Aromia moschata]|uniref:Endonuclease-reverse transcriptase n=1 Tax=Aromia moschata TaxID=1265417 RepID=A0AAV8YQ71_9CUCU|nr:hypothetical protein NQ318_004397 [Aromia moschata]